MKKRKQQEQNNEAAEPNALWEMQNNQEIGKGTTNEKVCWK